MLGGDPGQERVAHLAVNRLPSDPARPATRSLPALAALGVVGAVVVAGVAGGLGGSGGDSAAPTSITSTTTFVAATEAPVTEATTTTTEPLDPGVIAGVPDAQRTSLSGPIGRGMAGPEVQRLQERLAALKFDPGPIDGQYGSYTIQAVWAFEKLVLGVPRDQVTEVVTDEMWQRMQNALDVQPYRKASDGRATTDHTEVYLPLQVVVFFQNDEPALIAHISSGSDELWREEVTVDPGEMGNNTDQPKKVGYMALAHTPGGVFTYTRFLEGRRQSVLGGMYDPAYFNFGIAIHGAENVPTYPASHGCIRINKYLGEHFHAFVSKGDQVFVWNMEGDEPESAPNDYPWNQLDPDSPLNSTTTTAAPTTTVAAATTTRPAATTPPATQPPPTPTPAPTAAPTAPPTTVTTTTVAPATTTAVTVDPNQPAG